MAMFDGFKQRIFGHYAAEYAQEAAMGKLGVGIKAVWTFLDGWKSWIVAIIALYKLWCHDCAGAGYATAALHAVGWDAVTGAFDPAQVLAAAAVIVALGHRLVKAYRQWKTGVPMAYVGTNAGAVLEVEMSNPTKAAQG